MTQALAARASVEWLMDGEGHGREFVTLADVLRPPEWHRLAACRGAGTETFFPGRGGSTAAAEALCAVCMVRTVCLEYALGMEDCDGHWGATSAKQRQVMRRGAVVGGVDLPLPRVA
jgi:WhiB family transcriptional regulator, redox-sensing transcriptional regulator